MAEVMQRAIVLEDAIYSLCDMHAHNTKTTRLRPYILEPDEKALMHQLSPILDVSSDTCSLVSLLTF
jgi:hypothetical protein